MTTTLIFRQYSDGTVSLHSQGGRMLASMPTVAAAQDLLRGLGARRLDRQQPDPSYVGGTWVWTRP